MNEPMSFELSPMDVAQLSSYLEDLKAEGEFKHRRQAEAYHELQLEHEQMEQARRDANKMHRLDAMLKDALTHEQALTISEYQPSPEALDTAPSIYSEQERANIQRVAGLDEMKRIDCART